MTAGVPQCSVLGPLLWNLMYGGVLRLRMPNGIAIVDCADDIAIAAKMIREIEEKTNKAIRNVKAWLDGSCFMLRIISSRKRLK